LHLGGPRICYQGCQVPEIQFEYRCLLDCRECTRDEGLRGRTSRKLLLGEPTKRGSLLALEFRGRRSICVCETGTRAGSNRLARSHIGQYLIGGIDSRAHTVWYANATESISGQSEAWHSGGQRHDPLNSRRMPKRVLGHCLAPFVHPSEYRTRVDRQNRLQFLFDDVRDVGLGLIEHFVRDGAADKAADQGALFWGAIGKLVMNKRRGENLSVLGARDEQTKSRRQRATNALLVAEDDRHRGIVGNGI